LDSILERLGLESFGTEGDPFDPSLHEAVMHAESSDVSAPTATSVMRKGYRHGERLLRPAMVGVTDPASAPEADVVVEPEAQ
jgi:molecular chaperone GrpE